MDIVGLTLIAVIVYVVGGFWYAGANSMCDMAWVHKLYVDKFK